MTEPAWQKYISAVDALRPGCGEDEKRYRAGMMLLRDMAMNGMKRACPDSLPVLQAVLSSSIIHCTGLEPGRVEECHLALTKLMNAARSMEKAFGQEWRLQREARNE